MLGASIALIAGAPTAVAGSTSWAHQDGSLSSNGAVTVKSLTGGAYAAVQNPTGAVAKANQVASTQPPTVIIQATGGSAGYILALTNTFYQGNLGGITGANAKCVAEFGSGWRFAWAGLKTMLGQGNQLSGSWINDSVNCQNWTSSSGSDNGQSTNGTTGTSGNFYATSCNNYKPITCASF